MQKLKSYHITPIFCLVIFILTTLCGFIDTGTSGGVNSVLIMLVLQLLAVAIPGIIYLRLHGQIRMSKIGFCKFGVNAITLSVYAAVFAFCASVLLFLLLAGTGASEPPSLINISGLDTSGVIAVIVVYCVIPSAVEEFAFRGIIFSEYRRYGIFGAVLLSSVLFSLYHFSLSEFPVYLLAGIVLSLVFEVTHSVYASMLTHLIYNLLTVFLQSYLWKVAEHPDNTVPLVFITVSCMLLFLFLALYRAQCILKSDSVSIPESANEKFPPLAQRLRSLVISLVSPGYLACIACSAVISVLKMSNK